MDTSDNHTLMSVDSINQLRQASKVLRDLAASLENYANSPEPEKFWEISTRLDRTGWNALYTAALIRNLARSIGLPSDNVYVPCDRFFDQADAIFTALNYLSKSLDGLRESAHQVDRAQRDGMQITRIELVQRLKEVLNECKSFS